MLEDLLYKKSRERFNRGVQTKRVKSKGREMQTQNDYEVNINTGDDRNSPDPSSH